MLNAANEVAVAAFLAGKIAFSEIAVAVERVLSTGNQPPAPRSLEDVLALDAATRTRARETLAVV